MTWKYLANWNVDTFHWINASATPPFLIRLFALLSAQALIYLLALWMLFAWVRGSQRIRTTMLYALASILLGLSINQFIGLIGYHPRPFEIGIGQTLLPHAMDSSFPSDHAVVFFCAGLAFLFVRDTRIWGIWATICGLESHLPRHTLERTTVAVRLCQNKTLPFGKPAESILYVTGSILCKE